MSKPRKSPTPGARIPTVKPSDSLRRNLAEARALCNELTKLRKDVRRLIGQFRIQKAERQVGIKRGTRKCA